MSYSEKLYRLPRDLITIFRNYETIKRKEINTKWSAKFNETCLSENLWPKFTKLKYEGKNDFLTSSQIF